MSFAIRDARPSDAPAMLQLVRALAEHENELHQVQMTAEGLETALAAGYCQALLAEDADGDLRGLALYFFNFSTWSGRRGLFIEDLFVVPEGRGEGIGRALLKRCAQLAQERGCGRMEWNVFDDNDAARGFYDQLGAYWARKWLTYRLEGSALDRLAEITK